MEGYDKPYYNEESGIPYEIIRKNGIEYCADHRNPLDHGFCDACYAERSW